MRAKSMKLQERILRFAGLAWGAISFFMTTSMVSAEEIRQRQVVGDVDIMLSIPHAENKSPDSSLDSQEKHHLVIQLFKRGISKSIEGARVKASVAEAGFAGSEKILKPLIADGGPAYSGTFLMPGRAEYRITVQVRMPGESRAIEAHFEYRHHHELK